LLKKNSGSQGECVYRSQIKSVTPHVQTVIETVYNGIVSSLSEAAAACVPALAPQTLKPWWSEELNSLKKEAQLTFISWRSANKPLSGSLFDNYTCAKKTFRSAIKKRKQESKNSINIALMEALNSTTDFWRLWKSKLGKKKILPPCVGGATGENAIAAAFATYFSETCSVNSAVQGTQLRAEFLKLKDDYICNDNLADYMVSEAVVTTVIEKQKKGKAPGADSLSGEHLKNAHPILYSVLTKLFNCMILTEYVPDAFGVSTLVPIPKAGKSLNTVEGYRGISLTPVVSKIFEQCLMIKFHPYLKTSERQFGFKSGTGCTSAVYSVRKTVDYFTKKGATVNICSLDMEKAFDKMNRDALFIKMLKKRIPLTLINLFGGWFEKSASKVRWGKCSSEPFVVHSGTRQGGVFSPVLFSIFVDDILCKLEEVNCGCFINNICCNSMMYADDLILLAISINDMQAMLEVCRAELLWVDMNLNIEKSSAIRVGEGWKNPISPLSISNKNIPWEKEIKYLGMVIIAASRFTVCLHRAKIKYFQSLNAILGKVGDMQAVGLILSLAATNCFPILLYGLEACLLTKVQLKSLEYAYNAVFVKLFKTFDIGIINSCQYYTGFLSADHALSSARLRFQSFLASDTNSLPGFLCKAVGGEEQMQLTLKYNVLLPTTNTIIKRQVWNYFKTEHSF